MIRSLRDAGVVELGADGPRVHEDFQSDFSLNQALSLYVVEAVEVLDPEDVAYPLDVLTLVEATLEDPWAVLYRQTDALKSRALVTLEENVVAGGAGSAVGEVLAEGGVQIPLLHIGIPDRFIEHGSREDCLAMAGLDSASIRQHISRWWHGLLAGPLAAEGPG